MGSAIPPKKDVDVLVNSSHQTRLEKKYLEKEAKAKKEAFRKLDTSEAEVGEVVKNVLLKREALTKDDKELLADRKVLREPQDPAVTRMKAELTAAKVLGG